MSCSAQQCLFSSAELVLTSRYIPAIVGILMTVLQPSEALAAASSAREQAITGTSQLLVHKCSCQALVSPSATKVMPVQEHGFNGCHTYHSSLECFKHSSSNGTSRV
jgi:hypothetical protein